jgi:hypothetical protein
MDHLRMALECLRIMWKGVVLAVAVTGRLLVLVLVLDGAAAACWATALGTTLPRLFRLPQGVGVAVGAGAVAGAAGRGGAWWRTGVNGSLVCVVEDEEEVMVVAGAAVMVCACAAILLVTAAPSA